MDKTTGGERVGELSIDTNGDFTNTFQSNPLTDANASQPEAGDLPGPGRGLERPGGHRPYHLPRSRRSLVDPPVSRRGTTVTLTGRTSRPAASCLVFYDDDDNDENLLSAVLADSSGGLRMNFTVPSNAEIGEEQDIMAKSQANTFQYRTKATHALPEQELIVSPRAVIGWRPHQDRGP